MFNTSQNDRMASTSSAKRRSTLEVNGALGSAVFNLERLNELELYLREPDDSLNEGFRQVLITERDHPLYAAWWPHGHIIGWEHSFVHEVEHLLRAIVTGGSVEPYGASFRDGYRALAVAQAIEQSAAQGREVQVAY